MSIEIAPVAQAVVTNKPAAANDTKSTKGKAAASGPESADADGGFMAVLSALDTSGVDASLTPGAVAEVPVLIVDAPVDPTALLAQSALWNLPVPVEPLPTALGGAVVAAAVGCMAAASACGGGDGVSTELSGLPAAPVATPVVASGVAKAQTAIHGSVGLSIATGAVPPMTATKVAKDLVTSTAARTALSAEESGMVGLVAQADVREATLQERGGVLPLVSSTSQAALSALPSLVVAATSTKEERVKDRSIFAKASNDGFLPLQPVVSSPGAAVGPMGSMVGPTIDVYVAEQVKYWISNGVQSAEMKLDGLGGNPVEVSISMHGNEAQVAFRTDELHAREALEKASLHLKDMLQREGVVLTGVTVSTAGAGGQGDQERKPRSGARQAAVTTAIPAVNQVVLGANRATGRALDLFV